MVRQDPLADHRGDRKAWLTEMLGLPATDPVSYRWEQVQPEDEDYLPPARRLLHAVADRLRWEKALTEARRRAQDALAADAGAGLRELMDRMGHSTTRAALLYLHGSDERQRAVADAMSELTKDALAGQRPRRSGTQRARKRRTAS